jgi:RNA polymerase sigma factor (sigma-70 family)
LDFLQSLPEKWNRTAFSEQYCVDRALFEKVASMAHAPPGDILGQIQSLFHDGTSGGLTDGELLDRFTSRRDESAFSILIARHGAMVLRICRIILADEHDVQDAFQATFLVLVRRSHTIDRSGSVGPWLFGVCHRIAVRTKTDAARRRSRERKSAEMRARDSRRADRAEPECWPELYAELARLPEKYRAPVVLCYLEGQTTEEAARRLRCPRGTILSRLARARERLRGRLARRGLALPVAALTASRSPAAASASVPASVAASTVRAAAGTTPAAVLKIVEGMIHSMRLTQLNAAAVTLLAVGVIAGAAVLAQRDPALGQGPPPQGRSPVAVRGDVGAGEGDGGPGTALIRRTIRGRTLKGHPSASFCVAFSPDGKILASGGADRTILWDVATGKERTTFHVTRRQVQGGPHQGHPAVMALAFRPDNVLLAMACDDLTVRLRDLASGEERIRIPQDCFANTVAFAPDGRTLAWAGTNPPYVIDRAAGDWRVITLWDVAARRVRSVLAGHRGGISSLAFSADGTTIVSGSYDQTARLWESASGKPMATLEATQAIHGVAISPDGRVIAAATGNQYARDDEQTPPTPGVVRLWDVATRAERATLAADETSVRAVAFSPNGKVFASGGHDGSIRLWDVETKEDRAVLRGHHGYVYSLAFSPDGNILASAGLDSTVRLWQLSELLSPRIDQR